MPFKVKDHYFKKAKKEKFLARSVYKLDEIDQKYKVLSVGCRVIDLGYYPGSWVQYTSSKVGLKGRVVGVDIQEIHPKTLELPNVVLHQKDVFSLTSPTDLGEEEPFDVVLSDMAPSTTGIRSVDQDRSYALVEKVFALLPGLLKKGGHVVVKVFEGPDVQGLLNGQRSYFESLDRLRPKSTRTVSKELFVIGRGYKA